MQVLQNRPLTLQQVILTGHEQLERSQQIIQTVLKEGSILITIQIRKQGPRSDDKLHDVRQVLGRLEQARLNLLLLGRLIGWVLWPIIDAVANVDLDHI